MLEVLAGRDDRDMTSSMRPVEAYRALLDSDVSGKVIGVLDNVQEAISDERVKENLNSAALPAWRRAARRSAMCACLRS